MPSPKPRTGGRILVDQLLVHGADMAFCVPGESYLEVLDALHDSRRIRLVNARHEAGAANMAEAYGKLTGKPGICLVTRGPGACHGSIGVHTALQDSTPMIMLVGQVGARRRGPRGLPGDRLPADVRARSRNGRRRSTAPRACPSTSHGPTTSRPRGDPGPVVLALPEDMLVETAEVADAAPAVPFWPAATAADVERARALLARAERPLMMLGGSTWTDEGARRAIAFAEANGLPTCVSFRRQDLFASTLAVLRRRHRHLRPARAGAAVQGGRRPARRRRAARRDDDPGLHHAQQPEPRQTLIHVHPDADDLGACSARRLASSRRATASSPPLPAMKPLDGARWAKHAEQARRDYLGSIEPPPYNGEFDFPARDARLAAMLPRDAITVVEAGNHSGWPQRYLDYGRPQRRSSDHLGCDGLLGAGGGDGEPRPPRPHRDGLSATAASACAASRSRPRSSTAASRSSSAPTTACTGPSASPGTRPSWSAVIGTDLHNTSFAEAAQALGCHGEHVTRTDEFAPAMRRAMAAGRPAVVELMTDPNLVSTRLSIDGLRAKARERAAAQAS